MSIVERKMKISFVLAAALVFAAISTILAPASSSAATCDNGGAAPCISPATSALRMHSFYISSSEVGQSLRVWMSNLSSNYLTLADPEIYVVRWNSSAGGYDIVAYEDDQGASPSPDVTFTLSDPGYYYVMVTTPSYIFGGRGYLRALRSGGGTSVYELQKWVNFGSARFGIEYKWGDELLATKSTATPSDPLSPSFADPVMWVLDRSFATQNSCVSPSGGCGFARRSWNDIGTLDRMELDRHSSGIADVYVGSNSESYTLQPRVYHIRKWLFDGGNWGPIDHRDWDGDGLPQELELAIGTCDYSSGPADVYLLADGMTSCSTVRNWVDSGQNCDSNAALTASEDPSCWTPMDTDHDGLTDYEEIYGARRCFPNHPVSNGLGNAGDCVDADSDLFCDNECNGAFSVELPLSAMDSPLDPLDEWRPVDPRYWDGLVQTVSLKSVPGSDMAFDRGLTPGLLRQIYYAFEEEPTECIECAPSTCKFCASNDLSRFGPACDNPAVDCPNDDRHAPRLHVYETDVVVSDDPGTDMFPGVGGNTETAASINWDIPLTRKYLSAFRAIRLSAGSGGNAGYMTRKAVLGVMEAEVVHSYLHEYGHTLGLEHGGDDGFERKAAYPSIMACGGIGLKSRAVDAGTWNGRLIPCVDASDCPGDDFFACEETTYQLDPTGKQRYCLPRRPPKDNTSAWPYRFSRGAVWNVFDEDAYLGIAETNLAPEFHLHYMQPTERCFGEEIDAAGGYANFVADRFNAWISSPIPRGICTAGPGVCELDINRDSVVATDTGYDINLDGAISPEWQDDHDDWAFILRRSVEVPRRDWTYQRDPTVYATGFNASMHLVTDDGTQDGFCNAACVAAATPAAAVGETPSYTFTGGATIDNGPFDGFGQWLRIPSGGTSSLTLAASPELEALRNDPAYPDYYGFEISLWFAPAVTNAEWHSLITTNNFELLLHRPVNGTGGHSGTYRMWLRFAGGPWVYFDPVPGAEWWAHEMRRVRLQYDPIAARFYLSVSEGTTSTRSWSEFSIAGDMDRKFVNASGFADSAPVSNVFLGSGFYGADGWFDDVALIATGLR